MAAFVQDNIPITDFDLPPEFSSLPLETNHGVSAYESGLSIDSDSPMVVQDPSRPSSRNLSTLPPSELLSAGQIIQLTGDFFARSHPQLPCIHRETFLERLRGPQGPVLSTPLEWAILATAARSHRDETVSNLADMFLRMAVDLLAQSPLLSSECLNFCRASFYYFSFDFILRSMNLQNGRKMFCVTCKQLYGVYYPSIF